MLHGLKKNSSIENTRHRGSTLIGTPKGAFGLVSWLEEILIFKIVYLPPETACVY